MISNTVLSLPVSVGPSLPSKPAHKATLWRELCSFAVDALDLHSWREVNPMACILLAGFIAVVAEPLVHGGLPGKLVALIMR
jgi:hypothetical protein